ncbi:MAG: DNA-formamidopyrimidine glycosylase family protein, partial [Planctomycetota bacterium]
MPELPDVTVYIDCLRPRVLSRPIEAVRLRSPFFLRTADPPIQEVEGRTVKELRRIGKRIAMGLEDDLWLVFHLMIAGRFRWRAKGVK